MDYYNEKEYQMFIIKVGLKVGYYVNCFLVFPDTVYWVADNVITVEFSNSTVAVPRAGARIR